jgi:hypothetical protein
LAAQFRLRRRFFAEGAMIDPFVAGIDALFASVLAVDATYSPPGGEDASIRVIRSQPSADTGPTDSRIVVDENTFDIRRSQVAKPARGATITVGDDVFRINGAPMLDHEGMTWTCPTEPVA